jgi:hypothetical protein
MQNSYIKLCLSFCLISKGADIVIVGEIKLEHHLFTPVREKHSNIKAICSWRSMLLNDTIISSENKLSKIWLVSLALDAI